MSDMDVRCRSCGSGALECILELGLHPLANALLDSIEDARVEERFPLTLMFCRKCTLVQIRETVAPAILFGNYVYFSSFSDTMLAHARDLACELIETEHLGGQSMVIEAASNDGYLLQYYRENGIPVLGIEPAENVAEVAVRERGIATRMAFFDERLAGELAADGVHADVFHAHNVYAHVPDPNRFTVGMKRILKPKGVAIVEAPYVRDMIDRMEFDTVYHEHFSYFSLTAVEALARRHGLRVVDVRRVPVHGGSLRYYIRHEGMPVAPAVDRFLAQEKAVGLDGIEYYQDFAGRVRQLGATLEKLVGDLKRGGARIAAYGASAKGSTLLNSFGLGREAIEFIADRSTVKQGRLSPGRHLPIVAPEALVDRFPDYTLLLTWNFADEILEQQHSYRERGGRFIVPIPKVCIL